ncbi:MAG TPA: class II aldolase/adducin family protein [Thermomicrobiaceae bacterium]|nr:class II aldolase/adducin family protein [Thermomicrobiaceae bacterium]
MRAPEEQLRGALVDAVNLLFSSGVMQASGHGNLSARLDGDRMLLTSSGRIQGMTARDLAIVTFDGKVEQGELPPTTAEIVAMHSEVYRVREDVGAIIHTHSPHATMFAIAHEPLPAVYEALLRFGVTGDIPVAAWGPRGSRESVSNIVDQVKANPGTPAVLLANHGLLAFGSDPMAATQVVIAMEEGAQMTLGARELGGEKGFPEGALEQERAHMARFAGR